MIRLLTISAVAVLLAGSAQAQSLDGKALFHERCVSCHGPGGMGTGLLDRRVKPAELEKRTNLNAEYVFTYARRGLGNMPPITPGDVSDAELRAIAGYLAPPKGAK
jgi:mono/diheme cytochrome c family protein